MVINQIADHQLGKGSDGKHQKCIPAHLCRGDRKTRQPFVKHLGQGEGRALKDQPAGMDAAVAKTSMNRGSRKCPILRNRNSTWCRVMVIPEKDVRRFKGYSRFTLRETAFGPDSVAASG